MQPRMERKYLFFWNFLPVLMKNKMSEGFRTLQKEGVKVIHGVEGLKVHSKLVLVERKENNVLKGYAYVGTGNFNEDTARLYSDFGLFTSNLQIVQDARIIFDFLLNPHRHFVCKQLLVSPYYLRKKFEDMINREIKKCQKENPPTFMRNLMV